MPPERVVDYTEDIKERRPEISWPNFVMRMITSRQMDLAVRRNLEAAGSSSSTRTAVAPVLGFENREKKGPANKLIRRMSRRT
jgi:hypothetical protein